MATTETKMAEAKTRKRVRFSAGQGTKRSRKAETVEDDDPFTEALSQTMYVIERTMSTKEEGVIVWELNQLLQTIEPLQRAWEDAVTYAEDACDDGSMEKGARKALARLKEVARLGPPPCDDMRATAAVVVAIGKLAKLVEKLYEKL